MAATEFFLGRRSAAFAYAVEDVSYGTPNTATTWAWPGYVQKFTPNDRHNLFELNPMDGTDERVVGEHVPMTPSYGGTLEMLVQHFRFPAVCGFGADTVTGVSDPYTHTISLGNTLPSFGFQVGHLKSTGGQGKRYDGAMIKSWDLQWAKGDWLRFSADIVAQKSTAITSFKDYQASVDSLKKYTATDMRPFKGSDTTTYLNSQNISAYVTQVKIAVNNDLHIDAGMNNDVGAYIQEPIPQVAKMTAAITVKMHDDMYCDIWNNRAAIGGTYIKSTIGTRELKFELDGAMMEAANDPIDISGGIIIQELPLKLTDITVTDKNAISTDYDTVCA